ncbi:MAG: class II fructose-bisphosphate aldolase [Ignavibacteriaceae bacterium]
MKLQDKLKEAQKNSSAILAANYYNIETCKGIMKAAGKIKKPVILQLTESSIEYMSLKTAYATGRTLSEYYEAESWIHLDHCKNIDTIKRCLDTGFDSVMIDASDLSLYENAEVTCKVVELAKRYGANVEAELGYIPKPDVDLEEDKFTNPDEAGKFADETGVNALAVAIGSKHGFYKGEPKLDLGRLKQIKEKTGVCLVLHGGSGIPQPTIRQAIKLGITKVNVATETKDTFMRILKDDLADNNEIDLRKLFPHAITAVEDLISEKLKIISAD